MRKIILSILGVLLIVGAFFGAKTIIANKKRPKPKPDKVIKTVFTDTVKNTAVPIEIASTGSLIAKRRLELYAEVQGVFRGGAKLFRTGQTFNRGQVLIRMDATEYYASVQSAKSNLYNLITSIMPDLRLDYPDFFDKWQTYLDSFDMSKATPELPEVTSDQEKFFITGRNIYSSYYNVKNLEQRLSKYTIVAPFKGVLTQALVNEGTLIRPGQKLGEFIETGTYEMEIAIPKEYADLLTIGNKVTLKDLKSSKTYLGHIVRVNGSVDQASQTITSFVEISDPALREGMYLEAVLKGKEQENAIEMDRSLLLSDNEVYIVRDSILDVIPVQPVYFSDKKMVLQGIPDGTVVLSKSVPGAYAGMLVSPFQESKKENAVGTSQTLAD
ncbi:HlyD family efflux transporter periplasmic adaptor subunit [Aquimarina sp. ERC-38]|uniref:efflux RND transporter periplasmic adaptor subunit n=1 Tax=Aquimarina sp. ERC-38 TaxID=2949996 RepID=UPI0022468000|nr:HlyD family efflux transporter periplasmic adaptor subunit [Aquimarina sp. ERC-38]UZO81408.1 HlyD family efflux transporter periplasmic adaptor subunit [Aquimarina sp. ERC-38]